jgi:aspartokinase
VREVVDDLVEIIVLMSDEADRTRGVIAAISSQLAMNDINIQDYLHCAPYDIIVFKEKDALKAYKAIEDLGRKH